MANKKLRFWASVEHATARTTCCAATGPGGTWVDDNNSITAPYVICQAVRGWQVDGKINGCNWYVTRAVVDSEARHGFRTWREAYTAARRLYPDAEIRLRTGNHVERKLL